MDDEYLTVEELLQRKEFAHLKPATLKKRRSMRCGPPWTKIGRTPFYRVTAVIEWLRSRERGGGEAENYGTERFIGPRHLPSYPQPQKSPRRQRFRRNKTKADLRAELEAQKLRDK